MAPSPAGRRRELGIRHTPQHERLQQQQSPAPASPWRNRGRRVHLALRNSLSQWSSPSAIDFDKGLRDYVDDNDEAHERTESEGDTNRAFQLDRRRPWSIRDVSGVMSTKTNSSASAAEGNEDDDGDDMLEMLSTNNIDQAMRSLYSLSTSYNDSPWGTGNLLQSGDLSSSSAPPPTSLIASSSYVATTERDELLDGTDEWEQEQQSSLDLMKQFEESSNLDLLIRHIQAAQECIKDEDEETVNSNPPSQPDADESNWNDDDFGEFQSAPAVSSTPVSPVIVKIKEDDDLASANSADPSSTPAGRQSQDSLYTPALVAKADEVLRRMGRISPAIVGDGDGDVDAHGTCDTPQLLEQSEHLLRLEQQQQHLQDAQEVYHAEEKKQDEYLMRPLANGSKHSHTETEDLALKKKSLPTEIQATDLDDNRSDPAPHSDCDHEACSSISDEDISDSGSSSDSGVRHASDGESDATSLPYSDESESVDDIPREIVSRVPRQSKADTVQPPPDVAASGRIENQHSPSQMARRLLFEDVSKISLHLPVDDLSTIEARYTRRRQLRYLQDQGLLTEFSEVGDSCQSPSRMSVPFHKAERSTATIDELDLPSYYFSSNVDDTASVLQSLPWHFLPDYLPKRERKPLQATDVMAWEENMVAKLCELDTALECVNGAILSKIGPHQRRLEEANELVHEFEQNLRLAFMYHERSSESLQRASGSEEDGTGLVGSTCLLESWNRKDDYSDLSDVLAELSVIFEKEKDLLDRIDSFDTRKSNALEEFLAVSRLSEELQKTVSNGKFAELECLADLRERLATISQRFWGRLLSLAESAVVRSCRNETFDCLGYERLVKSVLDLHENAFTGVCHLDLARDWSQRILQALCLEADRALVMALLRPTDYDYSEHENDLAVLAGEVDSDWGDDAKLRTLTHNLVTIRFQLESDHNYLPRVFHKLMVGLMEVLHTHFLFTQWHLVPFQDKSRSYELLHGVHETEGAGESEKLEALLNNLKETREALWLRCENVIGWCLDEYLNFAQKPNLFASKDGYVDDDPWHEDLLGLELIIHLSNQFLSLKAFFLDNKEMDSGLLPLRQSTETSEYIFDKISDVCRRHLRIVHIQSMNSMGRALSAESWLLNQLEIPEGPFGSSTFSSTTELIMAELNRHLDITESPSLESVGSGSNPFEQFASAGNPFDDRMKSGKEVSANTTLVSPPESASEAREKIDRVLSESISETSNSCARLSAPRCVSDGLVGWIARLIEIIKRLPLIVEDTSAVFANLCDLYFTTVLRLCSGCVKSERIILGTEKANPFLVIRDSARSAPPSGSASIFGFRTGGASNLPRSTSLLKAVLPVSIDAEIGAPLVRNSADVSIVRSFIVRAQSSLSDVVSLEKVDSWLQDPARSSESPEEYACGTARILEKREAAIWSCFVVSAFADSALHIARRSLENSPLGSGFIDDLEPLRSYTDMMLEVTQPLVALASQFSCIRAIGGFAVVNEVLKVGPGWEECKLHEHPNDYVDELADHCALLWGFLVVSAKLPFVVRKATWERLVSAAYLAMLEGFARVPYCSTEGRALMTLDLASLSAGLIPASIVERLDRRSMMASPPPAVRPDRSEAYVDKYIKLFYYPPNDILSWIESNYQDYQLNHCMALAVAATKSNASDGNATNAEVVDRIKRLYERGE